MVEKRIKAGVDWGSSTFRAYRFDDNKIVDSISKPLGIKFVPENKDSKAQYGNRFERALHELIGDWLEAGDGVLLSGMITSVNGWVETRYLECPVSCSKIASRLTQISTSGINLYFLPGVCQHSPHPDVMRGEELQLLGVSREVTTNLIVMPGTHSKWAFVQGETLQQFRTIVTGELFDTLLNHTLVGQLSTSTNWHEPSFIRGVEKGYKSKTIISELFTCRSGTLLKQLDAENIHSYLSGLLIGNEIREGLTMATDNTAVTLIGTNALCKRYTTALNHFGIDVSQLQSDGSGNYNDSAALGFTALVNHFQ